MENSHFTENDRKIIIESSVKLERVIQDVRELKDNVAARVTNLEHEKVGVDEFDVYRKISDDHERRLRRNEKFLYIGIGGLTVIQIVIDLVMKK